MMRITPPANSKKVNAISVLVLFFIGMGLLLSLAFAVVLGINPKDLKSYFTGTTESQQICIDNGILMPSWPGEYPYPALSIAKAVSLSGTMTLCSQESSVFEECNVPPGLYHPWSETPARYAAIIPQQKYVTLSPVKGQQKTHSIGSELVLYEFITPTICRVGIGTDLWEMRCPNPMETKWLQPIVHEKEMTAQFFEVRCLDGVKRWIKVADSLFEFPEITVGGISSHGTVISSESETIE